MKKALYFGISLFALPVIVSAEMDLNLAKESFSGLIGHIIGLINIVNPILFTGAFVVFFWGLSKFILNSSKPEEIKNGKNYMMWSILILFVLLTYRTLIGLVAEDLEIGSPKPDTGGILLPGGSAVKP